MTISIGTVVLDNNLHIPDYFSQSSISGSVRPTIGGLVYQHLNIASGKRFTLTAGQGNAGLLGHFTGGQLVELALIRDAGLPVVFTHPFGTWNVLIPPEGISVDKLLDFQYPEAASTWYVGTITLITVD